MLNPIPLPESRTRPEKAKPAGLISSLVVVFLVWLATLHFPGSVPPPGLDSVLGAGSGASISNHWQAGVDYIFTYGPLGYFAVNPYQVDLFWWAYGWELIAKLVIAILVCLTLGKVQPAWMKWLFLTMFVLLPSANPDLLYPLALVLLFLTATRVERSPLWHSAVAASVCAVFSLMKFSFCILAVVVILCLSFNLLVRCRGRGRLLALAPISVFAVVFICLWLVLDQSVWNFPAFFLGGFQIVAGYGEAMAIEGAPAETLLALAILAGFAGIVMTSMKRADLSCRRLTTVGLIATSLFLEWKHGFVRQDSQHTVIFFSFTLCLAFCLPAAFPRTDWRRPPRLGLVTAIVLLAAIGVVKTQVDGTPASWEAFCTRPWHHARHNLAVAWVPARYRDLLDQLLAERQQEYALPRIAARVGDASIDYFSSELGLLLLNKMNWLPRPAFQSYMAYNRHLLAINANWLQGSTAPSYVILDLKPIDQRFPCLEDGAALLEILGRYEPILREKHCLLLKRRPGAADLSWDWKVVRQQRVQFGEVVAIQNRPGTLQTLRVEIRPSMWGRLHSAVYKQTQVWLVLQTAAGKNLRYRLIPAMADSRFLLNPLVQDTEDFLDLFGGSSQTRLTALAIEGDNSSWLSGEMTVTIEECASLPLSKLSAAEIDNLRIHVKK